MTPDIICSKTPWAPGWWQISAGTSRGRRWWVEQGYANIGWNLGSGSFSEQEVDAVLKALPSELCIEVAGVVAQRPRTQEVTHG